MLDPGPVGGEGRARSGEWGPGVKGGTLTWGFLGAQAVYRELGMGQRAQRPQLWSGFCPDSFLVWFEAG